MVMQTFVSIFPITVLAMLKICPWRKSGIVKEQKNLGTIEEKNQWQFVIDVELNIVPKSKSKKILIYYDYQNRNSFYE